MKIAVACLISLLVGVVLGWRGFYHYENHMFQKYPTFFRAVMERKIQRMRGEEA